MEVLVALSYALVDRLKAQYMAEPKWYSLRWHYIEGCILKAYLDSYMLTGDEAEYAFVKGFVDALYDAEGQIPAIDPANYNIDQIRMATVLFALYDKERDPKYKQVLDLLYKQLAVYPRTGAGSFWHKQNYPYQVWLDGLYMGQPFHAQYIKRFVEEKDYSDPLAQFRNARRFLFDEAKQLYRHAYDESRHMFWSDPATGHSPHVWGRGAGWYAMALVDMLEILQGEPADSGFLKQHLQELVDGMLPHQHSEGMWYQVVDQGARAGNYLETSGTLMLAYAILKGARLGYLPQAYAVYGQKAFDGTISRYMREEGGEVLLGGICRSAGLGRKPETGELRDGTYEYYVFGEKIVENNGHGVAPLLMAYNEIKRLKP
ncbi:glycoside hydrolase family 105 protein [Paenibacillus terreus]|uniref:Glycoside hydrolase family 105 protein n=1 Tax=Paenibacillus terreus TaxID=1387834 RepID=A0ABV5B6H9_9BACL